MRLLFWWSIDCRHISLGFFYSEIGVTGVDDCVAVIHESRYAMGSLQILFDLNFDGSCGITAVAPLHRSPLATMLLLFSLHLLLLLLLAFAFSM